jgi:hypothetical protein
MGSPLNVAYGSSAAVQAAPADSLVYLPLQTLGCATANRRSGHEETLAMQQTALLFDDFIGASKKQLRDGNAERLGGLGVAKRARSGHPGQFNCRSAVPSQVQIVRVPSRALRGRRSRSAAEIPAKGQVRQQ